MSRLTQRLNADKPPDRERGLDNSPELVSRAERVVYPAKKGSKPMFIGMNRAKRIARSADERDQLAVLKTLGPGLPRQHSHHQELVRQRHRYYRDNGGG